MAGSEKATTTMMWMKQLSTTTINSVSSKMKAFMSGPPLKRHIVLGVAVWLVANLFVFFAMQSKIETAQKTFYNKGVDMALGLADKSGSLILSTDLLSLNLAVREVMENPEIRFAAVLDHQDKVLAHSNPALINRQLAPVEDETLVDTVNGVSIASGKLNAETPVVVFKNKVTFSGVKIGKVVVGWGAKTLAGKVKSYRTSILLFLLFSAVLTAGILFLLERTLQKRKAEREKAMEGMTRIGPYLLTRKIAQGGMAELFLADYLREDGFRKTVAVKRVLPHLADNRDFIDMFIREARLAALLQHPNVVQIADFGKIQNAYFIAMEYVDGKNLAEIMGALKKGLAVDMAVFLILKISNALHYSHTRKDDKTGKPLNIVHRDISPQNILISLNGEVKLSDFGISKAASEPSLTQAGVIKGKLSYLSPEQAMGQEVNHQIDIYALGLVFYEILSGSRLYRFTNDIEAIRTIPKMTIPPIITRRPDIPQGLNDIVMKSLEKSTVKRYQTAQELHEDLLKLKNHLGITYDTSDLALFMRANFEEKETTETPA
ncbi:protein kinase [uncultured Desulfosarcina sp.]|uniref:serine/threonine protein kinase n=1 Tax=uncultured Desulfosarcina sp. TaxID=218289 RepID=UPI0029C78984|nr:protein kinase [uncultured Desulfosarcina sp.]